MKIIPEVTKVTEFTADNKLAENPPKRPFARYPGSKNRLAPWIISYLPARHDTYILPYGGLAATLFRKARSGIEVYNDLNGDVVHLFKMIRERPDELIHRINWTAWSPEELAKVTEPSDNDLERAHLFFVRLWQAFQPFDQNLSFRRQMVYSRGSLGDSSMVSAAKLFADTDYLFDIAGRLRGVVIEHMDALDLISMYDYDRALFYCDPPYVHTTRKRKKHYQTEMSDERHRRLAHVLNGIEGMAIVSGYKCDLYAALYEDSGWERVDRSARTSGRDRMESLWLSPRTVAHLIEEENRPRQMEMF